MPRSSIAQSLSEMQQQMVLLRDITRKTGTIHDAQALQLKLWPRAAFPHSTGSEAHLDTDGCLIKFYVDVKGRAPAGMDKRIQALMNSVQWLLGDEWTVKVYERKGKHEKVVGSKARTQSVPDRNKYAGTDFMAGMIVPERSWQFPKTAPQQPSSKQPRPTRKGS